MAFHPETFTFLADLATHNDRAWFQAEKRRYEAHVKGPMLDFVTALGPALARVAPDYVADPRPVGGSMFRIHRDTRFAADKSPYKTHAAAHFRHHAGAKDVHMPGFYFHVEPGACVAGAGIWQPEPGALQRIRGRILHDPLGWAQVRAGLSGLTRWGEQAKRVPPGFPNDHQAADELRWKDFVWVEELADDELLDEDFAQRYAAFCARTRPVMDWLVAAVGVDAAAS